MGDTENTIVAIFTNGNRNNTCKNDTSKQWKGSLVQINICAWVKTSYMDNIYEASVFAGILAADVT